METLVLHSVSTCDYFFYLLHGLVPDANFLYPSGEIGYKDIVSTSTISDSSPSKKLFSSLTH